jgi:hypothetical protein
MRRDRTAFRLLRRAGLFRREIDRDDAIAVLMRPTVSSHAVAATI